MGLISFLKSKFKRRKKESVSENDLVMTLDKKDTAAFTPPETRYTEEYKEFLASQDLISRETDKIEEETSSCNTEKNDSTDDE